MKRLAGLGVILGLVCACSSEPEKVIVVNAEGQIIDTVATTEEWMASESTGNKGEDAFVEPHYTTPVQAPAVTQAPNTTASPAQGQQEESSATAEETKKKKKLSNKTKGALIGAGVGFIAGGAANKKDRAKGAIIGGAIGSGIGFGTGAILDKKKENEENKD